MVYTLNERIFLVETYLRTRSFVQTRREFEDFHDKNAPSISSIQKMVLKFRENGNLNNIPSREGHTERIQSATETAMELFDENPSLSLRKASALLKVSYKSMHVIVTKDLGLHPYKLHVSQNLTTENKQRRLAFANQFLRYMRNNPYVSDFIIWTFPSGGSYQQTK